MSETIYYDDMPSPVGTLRLFADSQCLRQIWFPRERHPKSMQADWAFEPAALAFAREQLEAYFAGVRQTFDLPLRPIGTPFQCEVWRALADIPYATTISYGELARRIGQPAAMRAVGAANGRNPIPIVLPCHRVIGANGSLTGFGGGLPTKRWLLTMEDHVANGDLFSIRSQ
ncbi:MAG TPA: methylated-DNA--[protein]-cysteine S-methyltransferase [Dyella sp.]|uniref:methylated-DNA--[protein]-cysteine S-methyltransferase n=1 Tax=Dyella sp. TaxID=1869338 RepID=UPI002F91D0A9